MIEHAKGATIAEVMEAAGVAGAQHFHGGKKHIVKVESAKNDAGDRVDHAVK